MLHLPEKKLATISAQGCIHFMKPSIICSYGLFTLCLSSHCLANPVKEPAPQNHPIPFHPPQPFALEDQNENEAISFALAKLKLWRLFHVGPPN